MMPRAAPQTSRCMGIRTDWALMRTLSAARENENCWWGVIAPWFLSPHKCENSCACSCQRITAKAKTYECLTFKTHVLTLDCSNMTSNYEFYQQICRSAWRPCWRGTLNRVRAALAAGAPRWTYFTTDQWAERVSIPSLYISGRLISSMLGLETVSWLFFVASHHLAEAIMAGEADDERRVWESLLVGCTS
jgi:hypothetical protein